MEKAHVCKRVVGWLATRGFIFFISFAGEMKCGVKIRQSTYNECFAKLDKT